MAERYAKTRGSVTCINNHLPEQLLESIFSKLDSSSDRGSASQVCKLWQKLDGLTRTSVYISNCYSISPGGLSRRFKNLQKIKIKGKPRAYEFGLLVEGWGGHAGPWVEEIGRAYPRLAGLHLRRMDITDGDLRVLAAKCKKLVKLKLNKCCGFSTRGLQFISESCRSLRVLDLEESDDITDHSNPWLTPLLHLTHPVTSLNLASAGLTDEDNITHSFVTLAPNLSTLASLKVADMELESFFKVLESSGVPVVELGLGCYTLRVGLARELAGGFARRLGVVKVLDLKFATLSAEVQIELLRHCYCLEELELRSAVGDRGMQVIGESCKQLKRIRVDHITTSEYMTDYVTQKGMIAICEGCRQLDFFVMYLSDVNNEALAAVGRCLPKLTDFRIVLLEVNSNVAGLPLDDGVRALLVGCPLLTRFSVYLRKGGLTDVGLAHIGEFGSKLKWILLGCSGDTDRGLRLMAEGCRQLERLELRGCPFSSAQLAHSVLTMMTRLKYLWVQGVGATEALGAALVGRKSGFLVEFVNERSQILGYYTVAGPRKDYPESVCLIYPDKTKSKKGCVESPGDDGGSVDVWSERYVEEPGSDSSRVEQLIVRYGDVARVSEERLGVLPLREVDVPRVAAHVDDFYSGRYAEERRGGDSTSQERIQRDSDVERYRQERFRGVDLTAVDVRRDPSSVDEFYSGRYTGEHVGVSSSQEVAVHGDVHVADFYSERYAEISEQVEVARDGDVGDFYSERYAQEHGGNSTLQEGESQVQRDAYVDFYSGRYTSEYVERYNHSRVEDVSYCHSEFKQHPEGGYEEEALDLEVGGEEDVYYPGIDGSRMCLRFDDNEEYSEFDEGGAYVYH